MDKKKRKNDSERTEVNRPNVANTVVGLQRLKLQKLMMNPDKLVQLPERPKTKSTPSAPEFVRNVMGSSAGAGSGEFHVYRHLRRKEYARQKFIKEKSKKELLDEEYQKKIEENKIKAEELTAKKRARRLKKKQQKQMKKTQVNDSKNHEKVENEIESGDENCSDQESEGGDKDCSTKVNSTHYSKSESAHSKN